MKHPATLRAILGACALLACPVARALPPAREVLEKAYGEGVAAFKEEQFDTAENRFRFVLQHIPRHQKSRRYLVEIRRHRKAVADIPAMKKALAAITIPEFTADGMTLQEALSLFRQKAEELSDGKVVPNFVISPSTPEMIERPVTLSLNSLPMDALFDNLLRVTGTQAKFDPYAVVVSAKATKVGGESAASDETQESPESLDGGDR